MRGSQAGLASTDIQGVNFFLGDSSRDDLHFWYSVSHMEQCDIFSASWRNSLGLERVGTALEPWHRRGEGGLASRVKKQGGEI